MNAAMPTFKPKTYTYSTGLEWRGERAGMLQSEGKPPFRVASPPEFKGEPGTWTPEDLFVAAVETCTMTTFLALAARGGLPLVGYTSTAQGTLERTEAGFCFTRVVVRPHIRVTSPLDAPRALEILHDAHDACLIAKSIHASVDLEPSVEVVNS